MKYVPPIGAETEDEPYTTGNPALGLSAKPVPHEAIEHPMREIAHAIAQAGLTPSEEDLTQLYQALVLIAEAAASPVQDGDKGNIVVSGSGGIWTVKDGIISNAKLAGDISLSKLANIAANTILGNPDSVTGAVQLIACSAAGRALLAAADLAAQQATLGLKSAAFVDVGVAEGEIPVLDSDGRVPRTIAGELAPLVLSLNGNSFVDVTSIPAWVRRIQIFFWGANATGANTEIWVRGITADGPVNAGYNSALLSGSSASGTTNGLLARLSNQGNLRGKMDLFRHGNVLVSAMTGANETGGGNNNGQTGGGVVNLGGVLTGIRIMVQGAALFTGGQCAVIFS